MKSQKTFSVAAMACLTLLACSSAFAGEISGPIVQTEKGHTLSRPLREYSPLVMPELGSRIAEPTTITGLLNIAGQSAPKGQNFFRRERRSGSNAIRSDGERSVHHL